MIRSLAIGRLSNLSSTLIVALFVNVLLAIAHGIGLGSLNIDSMPIGDSMLYRAAIGGAGMFFAALTAVICQLCESNRGAMDISFGVLGVFLE